MELDDIELRRLADNLGTEWEKLATFLGFHQAKIEQLLMEGSNRGIELVIFDMLVSWRERQPVETTNFRVVMKAALENCGRKDLADSIPAESAGSKLDEINSILHGKLAKNPDLFHDAILAFHEGIVSIKTDIQLSLALAEFAQQDKEKLLREEKKKTLENEKQAVTKWQKVQQINKRGNQDDKFHCVSSVALHDSGNIAVIDANNKMTDLWKRGSPRVYVFNSDGMFQFVLNSTEPDENPVGKLVNAQGIAVTREGNYIVADGTKLVKIFDVNGQFLDSFSTLTDDDDENTRVLPNCIAVNGDVLVGDNKRELVTVHGGNDFNITKVVHVSLKPVHIAVNNRNQILITTFIPDNLWESNKVVAFDYSGDEIYTINPMIAGGFALPHGLACNSDCTTLIAVSEADDRSRLTKPNSGHVHHYNRSGEFLKCVVKGLYWPLGIALNNDVLAIADKESAKVFKPEN